MATSTNQWTEINTRTLPVEVKTFYADYIDAQDEATKARKAFEAALLPLLKAPKGKKIAFGYKWGKLSIALVDDTGPSSKGALDLSTLLKAS
jgi:hypothetical protein